MAEFRARMGTNGLAVPGLNLLPAIAAALLLAACSGTPDLLPGTKAQLTSLSDDPSDPNNELRKATDYWGKRHAEKPTDKTAALSYARNLKALGQKREALGVMQDAYAANSNDAEVAGEYGRLAVEFDQYSGAAKALEFASNAENPDWKVLSARGTLLSKQGQYKAAMPYFERALKISPNQPSVLNNLALATAMSGDAKKAEEMLRAASESGGATAKVNQNLALVLGLQGKYDEAKSTGSRSAPTEVAEANTEYVRRMVRLDPKAVAAAPAFKTAVTTPALRPATTPAQGMAQSAATGLKSTSVDTASAAPAGAWQTNVASTEPAGR